MTVANIVIVIDMKFVWRRGTLKYTLLVASSC